MYPVHKIDSSCGIASMIAKRSLAGQTSNKPKMWRLNHISSPQVCYRSLLLIRIFPWFLCQHLRTVRADPTMAGINMTLNNVRAVCCNTPVHIQTMPPLFWAFAPAYRIITLFSNMLLKYCNVTYKCANSLDMMTVRPKVKNARYVEIHETSYYLRRPALNPLKPYFTEAQGPYQRRTL